MYKYETHLHTQNCSACAYSTPKQMINALKEKGYAGTIITNHFYHGNTAIDRNLSWREFVEHYENDYLEAKEYGDSVGIKVFFGIEEGIGGGKEVIICGVTPEALKSCDDFVNYTTEQISEFAHKNGGIIIAAHPFRNRPYISNPDKEPDHTLFDAIEGFNLGNRDDENVKGLAFAKKHGLPATSGGDVHVAEHIGHSGIAFDYPIETDEQLVEGIKSGNFKLIGVDL